MTLRALGAAPVAATIEEGTLVYRDAYPATDSIYLAGDGQIKEFLYLRDPGAPTRFAYSLEAGRGAALALSDNGGVRISSAGATLHIAPPWLLDASGRHVTEALHWELTPPTATTPARLTLMLDPTGLRYPLAIDPTWSALSSMSTPRVGHTATRLADGRVLVAGGEADPNITTSTLTSAEIYDPTNGSWTTVSPMSYARANHTATLLNDGRVLVVGGSAGRCIYNSAEIYDPGSDTWSPAGALNTARCNHVATLLNDGRVLVVGGASSGILNSAEIYDPAANSWTVTGAMSVARIFPTATLLNDGRVLVAGGLDGFSVPLSSAELYDPATGSWSSTGSMASVNNSHTATLLGDGRVLVAGGQFSFGNNPAELYDPATGSWSATGSLTDTRYNHTATLLDDGSVLVVGGDGGRDTAERYDPVSQTWTSAGVMTTVPCVLSYPWTDRNREPVANQGGRRIDQWPPSEPLLR